VVYTNQTIVDPRGDRLERHIAFKLPIGFNRPMAVGASDAT
jgi:hypothetical protein